MKTAVPDKSAPLRCLVVDDEAPAHAILKNYIGQVVALEFVASAFNAVEAINWLHAEQIDLIFLDLNMPRMTGLEMLESLTHPPRVILTTAYAEFALKSYDHGVVDYLLKPIAFPRFLKAVNKIIGAPAVTPIEATTAADYCWIKTDSGVHRIDFQDIAYLQSYGNYTRIVLRNGTRHLTLLATKELEAQLPAASFCRVHKSYIIQLACLTRLEKGRVFLGTMEVPVGAMYRKGLLERIGG